MEENASAKVKYQKTKEEIEFHTYFIFYKLIDFIEMNLIKESYDYTLLSFISIEDKNLNEFYNSNKYRVLIDGFQDDFPFMTFDSDLLLELFEAYNMYFDYHVHEDVDDEDHNLIFNKLGITQPGFTHEIMTTINQLYLLSNQEENKNNTNKPDMIDIDNYIVNGNVINEKLKRQLHKINNGTIEVFQYIVDTFESFQLDYFDSEQYYEIIVPVLPNKKINDMLKKDSNTFWNFFIINENGEIKKTIVNLFYLDLLLTSYDISYKISDYIISGKKTYYQLELFIKKKHIENYKSKQLH